MNVFFLQLFEQSLCSRIWLAIVGCYAVSSQSFMCLYLYLLLVSLMMPFLHYHYSFEAKEKEIQLERQTLSDRQKVMQQTQERLLDAQALLNQREEYVLLKTQEFKRYEKELDDLKSSIAQERLALGEEKISLELRDSSLSAREEVNLIDHVSMLGCIIFLLKQKITHALHFASTGCYQKRM